MTDLAKRKELRLRYDGACRDCNGRLHRGERALYEKATRSVICLPCSLIATAPVTPGPGVAGASAARVSGRLKQQREARARAKAGGFGVLVNRLKSEPQHIRAWDKGARGEQHVGKRLERLLDGTGVLLMHDRQMPGTRANIDHIAVGRGGITVIDAKSYKGKVRVERTGGLLSPRREDLRINGRRQTKLVEGVQRQVQVVRGALVAARCDDVDVKGALAFLHGDGLPLFCTQTLGGVLIDGCRSAAKLAKRDGDLSSERIDAIYRELCVRLLAA